MECKGRLRLPDSEAKAKAKQQACRLRTINGVAPQLHIGGIAYLRSDVMQFHWQDPPPEEPVRNPIDVKVSESDWRYYYGPILELVRSRHPRENVTPNELVLSVEELDLAIQVDREVLKLLEAGQWTSARRRAEEISADQPDRRGDGIRVVAGDSWLRPFEEQ
jgi:hypothetical protein